jgi:hypothetical protein
VHYLVAKLLIHFLALGLRKYTPALKSGNLDIKYSVVIMSSVHFICEKVTQSERYARTEVL